MERVYKIDFAIILVSVFVLIFLVGYMRPLVIAPLDDYETNENEILFVIERADVLLIDDNIDFTTPDAYEVRDGLDIRLEPGQYYWKAVGVFKSEIRTFTINSVVNLELRELDGEGYGVVNAGSVRLNVDVYNGTDIVDKVSLSAGREAELNGSGFGGSLDE